MRQLWLDGSRTDPQLTAARRVARPPTNVNRRFVHTVRGEKEDAGTRPQPQQPPTSQPKRLVAPPARPDRKAVAQPPSSIPRIRWRRGQQQDSSLPPQQPDVSSTNPPATHQHSTEPSPHKQPSDDSAQPEQQQQKDAGPAAPTGGPAERSGVPGASSRRTWMAGLQPPTTPLPELQPYLQQQQQVYSRMEQQQHTQRRQGLQARQQQQQQKGKHQPQQQEERSTASTAPGPQQKHGKAPLSEGPGISSATTISSSSSSSGGGDEEVVISVAPQHRRPPPPPSSFTPIHQVSKTTPVHRLGSALAAESALSPHQLVLAWGPEAVNIAVKGCATARRILREESGGTTQRKGGGKSRPGSGPAAESGAGGTLSRGSGAAESPRLVWLGPDGRPLPPAPQQQQQQQQVWLGPDGQPLPPAQQQQQRQQQQQQGWELLVQPTLRSHGVGTAAVALDVFRISRSEGAVRMWRPDEDAPPGVLFRRIASTANEHMWARSLAANMPRRHQTVLTVCGAQAVLTAVVAVAMARDLMRRSTGDDLVLLPQWGFSRAHKKEVGLQLVVMCCTDEFPPQLLEGPWGQAQEV